ncbi:MAG: hypothetical protein V2J51_10795 [Erythrobacter sp.]|jgi:pimeloyl-ACP methyl ester carboxylesterase|nr:hypothetical protein [Erythrobacter sp.]
MNEHFAALYGGVDAEGTRHQKDRHFGRLKAPFARGVICWLLCLAGWTSFPPLPFLAKEMLILMGQNDRIVHLWNGTMLDFFLPRSRMITIEGGGHLFVLTHAEQSVAAMRDFLDMPDAEYEAPAAVAA